MEWQKPTLPKRGELRSKRVEAMSKQFAINGERQAHFLDAALTAVESQGIITEATAEVTEQKGLVGTELPPVQSETAERLQSAFANSEIDVRGDEIRVACHLEQYDLQVILKDLKQIEDIDGKQNNFKVFAVESLTLRVANSRKTLDWMKMLPPDVKLRLLQPTGDTARAFDGCFYNTGHSISFRGFRNANDIVVLLHEIGHSWNAAVDPDAAIEAYDVHSALKTFGEMKSKGIEAVRRNDIRENKGKSTLTDPLVDDADLQASLALQANSERFASLFAQEIISKHLPELKRIGKTFANWAWGTYDTTALTPLVAVSETARNLKPEQRRDSWQFYLKYLEARDELTYSVAESGQAVFEIRVGASTYTVDASELAKGVIQLKVKKSLGRSAEYTVNQRSINVAKKSLFGRVQANITLFDSVGLEKYGKQIARFFSEISKGLDLVLIVADEAVTDARARKSKLLEKYFDLRPLSFDNENATESEDLASVIRNSFSGETQLANDARISLLSKQIDQVVTDLGPEFALNTNNFDNRTGTPLTTKWKRLMYPFREYLIAHGHATADEVILLTDEELVQKISGLANVALSEGVSHA